MSAGKVSGIDSFTKIILHMNGTDASIVFTDSSLVPKIFTANGNAQIDTAQFKFGGASGLFDGTGDWADAPDNSDFDLGSGDFTIDFWIRRNAAGVVTYICGQCDSGLQGTTTSFTMFFDASNHIAGRVCSGGTAYTATSSGTITNDSAWHHVAFVRYGNTCTVYIDGVSSGTASVTGITVNNSANKLSIGRAGEATGNTFNGWIDEFRLSKGIARWTSNFTPPTSEYAA